MANISPKYIVRNDIEIERKFAEYVGCRKCGQRICDFSEIIIFVDEHICIHYLNGFFKESRVSGGKSSREEAIALLCIACDAFVGNYLEDFVKLDATIYITTVSFLLTSVCSCEFV